MISGRQALGSIDKTVKRVRSETSDAETGVATATEQLLMLQKAQGDNYRELALVRVERLADPELVKHLDHAERQVRTLLEDRNTAIASLQQQIVDAQKISDQHETERDHQAGQLSQAVAAVDEAEAITQARLNTDPAYIAQRTLAEQAERKALHATDKATRSEQEKQQKGAAYDQDPLFIYLWKRAYGLPEYEAGNVARWLDSKVARLIDYEKARANYSRLTEIPLRLREHSDHLQDLADEAYAQLRQLDEDAQTADGITDLEVQVASQQTMLDVIDERILQGEENDQVLQRLHAKFAAGEDEHTVEAVNFMANEFRRDDLMELRHEAFSTPYPEDDLIVSQMLQLEDRQTRLESAISGQKAALEQQQRRLLELESLRTKFKQSRFDREGSVFSNDSMIGVLLGQFLAGLVDRKMLWKVLKEHQRYQPKRSDPGFGSGGFGRGTVWKGGMNDVGDIIGTLGRAALGGIGRGKGGGRRRGGNRGGGGFRTGGGF